MRILHESSFNLIEWDELSRREGFERYMYEKIIMDILSQLSTPDLKRFLNFSEPIIEANRITFRTELDIPSNES